MYEIFLIQKLSFANRNRMFHQAHRLASNVLYGRIMHYRSLSSITNNKKELFYHIKVFTNVRRGSGTNQDVFLLAIHDTYNPSAKANASVNDLSVILPVSNIKENENIDSQIELANPPMNLLLLPGPIHRSSTMYKIYPSARDAASEIRSITLGFDKNQVIHVASSFTSTGESNGNNVIDNSTPSSTIGDGWLLDKVEIIESEEHKMDESLFNNPKIEKHVFPLGEWIGESDNGNISGPPVRTIQRVKDEKLLRKFDERRNLHKTVFESEADTRKTLSRASSAKYEHESPWKIAVRASAVPHPDKVKKGERASIKLTFGNAGEDAYFTQSLKDGELSCFGVADGVYCWREKGIDAGIFSRALMKHSAEAYNTKFMALSAIDQNVHLDYVERRRLSVPEDVLYAAATKVSTENIPGSSTICVACFDGANESLRVANIGDSGLLVIRPRIGQNLQKTMTPFRTEEQEHSFGHPFQLGNNQGTNAWHDAHVYKSKIKLDDVLVMGSDGLFDNLSDTDIQNIILKELSAMPQTKVTEKAQRIANSLVKSAFEHSVDKNIDTPYSRAASEAFDMIYKGGKKDDITVLCGIVYCDNR